MALIKCKECGKEFSDTASSCPNCGNINIPNKSWQQLNGQERKNVKAILWDYNKKLETKKGISVILLFLGLVLGLLGISVDVFFLNVIGFILVLIGVILSNSYSKELIQTYDEYRNNNK